MMRLLLAFWLSLSAAFAQGLPPAPTAHVTDPQGFLSPSAKISLAKDLEALEQDAPCQAVVWIGKLPAGSTMEDFAARAFKAWGIGHQGTKDGVALFVFPKEHKLRIEVGYGLEDRLTDLACGRILREEVSPRLQHGDREGALRAGVAGLRAVLVKAPVAPPSARPAVEDQALTPLQVVLLILAILIGFILLMKLIQWLTSGPSTYSSRGRYSSWGSSSSYDSSSSWSDSSSSSSSSDSSFTDSFSGGGGDSGGGGASGDW